MKSVKDNLTYLILKNHIAKTMKYTNKLRNQNQICQISFKRLFQPLKLYMSTYKGIRISYILLYLREHFKTRQINVRQL